MDKQEAIRLIYQMLEQDHTSGEIVDTLVGQLNAPRNLVEKFVTQTETEYRNSRPKPPPVAVQLPPWLQDLTGTSVPAVAPSAPTADQLPTWVPNSKSQEATAPQALSPMPPTALDRTPSWEKEAEPFVLAQLKMGRLEEDIASELVDRIGIPVGQAERYVIVVSASLKASPPPRITNTTQAAEFVLTEYKKNRPRPEIAYELAQRSGEPQHLAEKFMALTIAKYEKSQQAGAEERAHSSTFEKASVKLEDPELVSYVVGQLAKNRKRSDIVMAICERTGAEWSQVQRFVGQVAVEHHAKINTRKNAFVIPVCVCFIVGGFALTLYSATSVMAQIFPLLGITIEIPYSIQMIRSGLDASVAVFGTGLALIAGGIIGLIFAIRSQME